MKPVTLAVAAVLAASPVAASAGFKITFGLKRKAHGVVWNGGVRNAAQVRGLAGWHLDEADAIRPPDRWDITLRSVGGDITAKAVILDLVSPEEHPVTFFTRNGDFTFVPAEIPYGALHYVEGLDGDVSIERVPVPQTVTSKLAEDDDPALLRTRDGSYWLAWVAYRTRERDGYNVTGADEVMVARSPDGRTWSRPVAITSPGDHFRVALGEDGRGHIWCVYGLQKETESGNFDLYARVFEGGKWSEEQQLTRSPMPDVFHRVASDQQGNLYLVWMGFRGPPAQSEILMRVRTAEGWSEELNVSASPEDDWEPAVAARDGRAWVAWDAYRGRSGYDLLLRPWANGALGPATEVSATPFAEMRADVAVDGAGRVWISWEEGGPNWGKDTGYQNPKHRIRLRQGGSEIYGPANSVKALYRRPRVAVLAGGQLLQPRAEPEAAYPDFLQQNLFQNPRLGVDGAGRVWLFLRHQTVAKGRNAGHFFDFYATTLAGAKWMHPVLLPASTARQDTLLATAAGEAGIVAAVVGDGRQLPVVLPVNHEISTMVLEAGTLTGDPPALVPFRPSPGGEPAAPHPREDEQVRRVRAHRVQLGGQTYKIVRGDLHRHTEISMDGAIDGSLWDLYRYALNAVAFDYIAVTDHNYGAWLDTDEPESRNTDDEYQWWRTQKSCDIFHAPGRFVPLYGFERSINFPLGHRNIFHTRRGVFSYRVPKLHISERPEMIDRDAQGFWAYLRATGGIGIAHTSGTTMGTDWRLRDDAVEPVTEIYQGCRNNYEEEGAPRAAAPDSPGPGGAGRAPFQKGLIWNALGAGHRMGFIASSDHFSTHISYANLLVPDRLTTREDIQEAFRQRRTYASTDNIIIDFHGGGAMQGGELAASASPAFQVKVIGTEPILRVEVIKNNRVVYTTRETSFAWRDTSKPEGYYYLRVIQSYSAQQPDVEGEIAWSSPIFVRR
ncbi:MAG: hypothetical protein AAB225_07605 [Acidobacteriota bacterium]